MRTEWITSNLCDHVDTVCLNCCTPAEREALGLDRDEAEQGTDAAPTAGGVYILHYLRRYPNGRRPQHYLGWARNIRARVRHHADGTSLARLPEVMYGAGIPFVVARVWTGGDKALERRLKQWNKGSALCPLCRRTRQQLPLPLRTSEGAPAEPSTPARLLAARRIAA